MDTITTECRRDDARNDLDALKAKKAAALDAIRPILRALKPTPSDMVKAMETVADAIDDILFSETEESEEIIREYDRAIEDAEWRSVR